MICEAQQTRTGDMQCSRCGYYWDMDDKDPPECLTDAQLDLAKLAEIKKGMDG